jgi:hypothetical protein
MEAFYYPFDLWFMRVRESFERCCHCRAIMVQGDTCD